MRNRRHASGKRWFAREATLLAIVACSSSSPHETPPHDGGVDTRPPRTDSSTDGKKSDGTTRDAAEGGPVDSSHPVPWGDGGDGADGPSANLLIADQFNNRVIEIDWQGTITWTFGDGSTTPGATSIVAPNDAERLPNGDTLIAGSGLPRGSGPYGATEPACIMNGCPDNRVIIVDQGGTITWQYGQDGGASGTGADELNTPVGAQMLSTGNVLITDQGNNRVIEVTQAKTIAWQFPPVGADGAAPDAAVSLNSPNSAQRLASGDTLIADQANDRVIEVNPGGAIVWQYPATMAPEILSLPAFASRLPNGDTLMTDSGNSRVLEVTPTLEVMVVYNTATRASSFPMPFPTHAVRLADGDTLISDQLNDQVIEVSPARDLIFTYGVIQHGGNAPGELNAPYDAKVIGDYTGLSAP